MITLDFLFDSIIRFALLAFLLLGASFLIVGALRQPLERIRLIQISLASLFLATIISQASWKPSIELALLPVNEATAPSPRSTSEFNSSLPANGPRRSAESLDPTSVAENHDRHATPPQAATVLSPQSARAAIGWDWVRLGKQAVVFGFVGISILQVIYLLAGLWLTRRLVTSACQPAPTAEERLRGILADFTDRTNIRFASSDRITVPMVSGMIHPTILLPAKLVADGIDTNSLRHSIAHEWKHIDRHDLVTWQLTSFCQSLLWIQPFYWILRRELRVSQDQIADQFAARQTDDHVAYAETLFEFCESKQRVMLGALTMAGTKSNLYRRIEMLLNEKFQVSGFSRKRVLFGLTALMAAAGMLLASLEFTQAAVPEGAPQPIEQAAQKSEQAAQKSEQKPNEEAAAIEVTAESVEHSGVVVDAQSGDPIEGATVVVTRMNSSDWRVLDSTESITDADGKYTFEIPPDQLKQRLLYILFDLRHPAYVDRHCGSYGYSMIVKNLKLGTAPWFAELKMLSGTKVHGRLIDEAGAPVANAQLRMRSTDPAVDQRVGSSNNDGVSGKDGRFEFIVAKNGTASLSIIPHDHCMKHVDLASQRGDVGDITLEKGSSIRGRVLNAKGEPMKDLWVNLTEQTPQRQGSYEMKRSAKTNELGEFTTRPLRSGKYMTEVELKATGALEKLQYANFHDDPPPAMFVRQVIEVANETLDQPFVIQAVPHVFISGRCVDSKGEVRGVHSPHVMGQFNDQTVWVREGRKVPKGSFELMVPHGIEGAQLNFMTNEHSGLTVQFPEQPPSTQTRYRFDSIEEDMTDIKIVRYVAPILFVNVVDEEGNKITQDVSILATYQDQKSDSMMMRSSSYFERQKNGLYQSSSLVPGLEFVVNAKTNRIEGESKTMTLDEGATETITLTVPSADEDDK